MVHRLNDGVAFVLMSIAFWLAVAPVSIVFRLVRSDILDRGLRAEELNSYWLPVQKEEQDISRVQRQY